jgi:glycosyltransferase involved in cell wall biosynthesis
MNDNRKLLIITTSLGIGGAEKILFELTEKLSSDSFRIEIISFISNGYYKNKLSNIGVTVHELNLTFNPLTWFNVTRIIRIIYLFKPDVVQTWLYHADLIGGICAKLMGVKRIYWNIRHSNLSFSKNSYSTLMIAKLCAWFSDIIPTQIVTCSEQSIETHARFGYEKSKFLVISNGFYTDKFKFNPYYRNKIRSELKIEPDAIAIGLFGRYHPQKNHKGLIQAIKLLEEKHHNLICVLAGKYIDYDNTEMTSLITELSLNDRFILLGERSDIALLYNALDYFALVSYGEGFPNVLGEAMLSGVICLTTDAGDSYLIMDNYGVRIKSTDPIEIARSLDFALQLNKEGKEKIVIEARNRIINTYSINNMVKNYKELYSL